MKGWECPVCGKGLAPHVNECDCVKAEKPLSVPSVWPVYPQPPVEPYKWYPYPFDYRPIITCDGTTTYSSD